jgi:hypothetical protein
LIQATCWRAGGGGGGGHHLPAVYRTVPWAMPSIATAVAMLADDGGGGGGGGGVCVCVAVHPPPCGYALCVATAEPMGFGRRHERGAAVVPVLQTPRLDDIIILAVAVITGELGRQWRLPGAWADWAWLLLRCRRRRTRGPGRGECLPPTHAHHPGVTVSQLSCQAAVMSGSWLV